MANRLLISAGLWIALAVSAGVARAETIELVIDVFSGDVTLYNPNPSPFAITGYSIESTAGSLDSSVGVWTSISEFYDVSGDQSVDMYDEWMKLSPPGSTSNLSEIVIGGDGGSLEGGKIVSLGHVWNTALPPNLAIEVEVAQPAGLATVNVSYVFPGDFNGNETVDAADYTVWRDAMETGATVLLNDPTPGSVTEDDFLMWRSHFGEVLSFGAAAGSGLLSVATVPEPATMSLLIVGGAGWLVAMRRRPLGRFSR